MDRGHLAQDRTTRIEEMHSDALIQIQTGDCRRQYCQSEKYLSTRSHRSALKPVGWVERNETHRARTIGMIRSTDAVFVRTGNSEECVDGAER
jgi:hypothetical protein